MGAQDTSFHKVLDDQGGFMAESERANPSILSLIAVPAVITLAVTILRLVGELQNWSSTLFNPTPGGGGSLIGIVWLVPIFGVYFAVKLRHTDDSAPKPGRTIVFSLLGLAVMVVGFVVIAALWKEPGSPASLVLINLAGLIAGVIQLYGWPALARVLLAYGVAARIPVVAIMFFAIKGNWGTHYDGPPPNFPEMGWVSEFLLTGLLPQLLIWVAFTMVAGSLFGGIAAALTRRRVPSVGTA
jgi:hypothetical protein